MIDIPSFAGDVLIEILLQLPIKQVCQLKIVSKHWLFIISSPHFKVLYNKRLMRTPRLLVVEESSKDRNLSRTVHMSTMDISTGVICREYSKYVQGGQYSSLFACNLFCYYNYGSYSICNPTTREHLDLPDPTGSTIGVYCGYLQDTNEYKLVHIASVRESYEVEKTFQFKILTLKDGEPIPSCWRIIATHMPIWSYDAPSVSIDCSIYWLVDSNKRRVKNIISIDLKTEKFTTISCPEVSPAQDHENDGDSERLIEIKGELCLARLEEEHSTLVTIFVLKDLENNIWAKEYSIDLSNMDVALIGHFPSDNNNAEILLFSDDRNLLFYNIDDGSFERQEHAELPEECYVSFHYHRLFSFGGKEKKTVQGKKEDGSSSHTEKEKEKEDVE